MLIFHVTAIIGTLLGQPVNAITLQNPYSSQDECNKALPSAVALLQYRIDRDDLISDAVLVIAAACHTKGEVQQ